MNPRAALLAAFATIVAFAPPASAHDWWLEPNRCRVALGESVDVATFVGPAFHGERVARVPDHLVQFVAIDATGPREVVGAAGAEPAGRFVARASGTTVVAFQSKPARLFLRAPEFEKYLNEEGLERIVALRAERGHSGRMGLEQFSRCAKALVQVDGATTLSTASPNASSATTSSTPCDREIGLPLELVAQDDPASRSGGGPFSVRLTFHGEPLAGTLVMAVERDHPDDVLKIRSDADGRARFELPRGGFWLVKAVHMVEAPKETKLDWDSLWASLTFSIR